MIPGIGSLAFDSLGGTGGLANNGISSNATGDKESAVNFGSYNYGSTSEGSSESNLKAGIFSVAGVAALGLVVWGFVKGGSN